MEVLCRRVASVLAALLISVAPAPRVDAQDADSVRLAALERRIEAVTRELERMQLGRDVVEADVSIQGLGPGASKVYRVNQGVSLGGYGEFLYENFAPEREDGSRSGALDRFDALRAILYVGYKFNDRLLFNSELEIEHAKESFLEFAYLDYLFTDHVGVRAGMLLAPLGLVNELHEPPVFLGTERPVTESRIIPTTWGGERYRDLRRRRRVRLARLPDELVQWRGVQRCGPSGRPPEGIQGARRGHGGRGPLRLFGHARVDARPRGLQR